ncbi:MAG: hypothetical protein JKY66_04945 [Spongiibacteraceae bacterium]|nr:hypothetical protein [Spongiibacteraceae bacterium]
MLGACTTQTVKSTEVIPLEQPQTQIPEDELLDVGVAIFDTGMDELLDEEDSLVFSEIRNAEAHFIPYRLMESLQHSANWGAVRLISAEMDSVDLKVDGKIINSNGEYLELRVVVKDASGVQWFSKTYKSEASKYSYEDRRLDKEPFRSVYNTIANDMVTFRNSLSAEDVQRIRMITELKFAQSFSPDAFEKHLNRKKDGLYEIKRAPSENDPILQRVRTIRERDYLFVDTLQEYYLAFATKMSSPYQEWRKQSYKEVVALRELRATGTRRVTAGVVAILAGIFAAGGGDGAARAAGQVGVVGGGYLIKSGMDKHEESKIHVEALAELGSSMEGEISPQVIELEERTVTLTGTVEGQYQQWRRILKDIYDAEVGDLKTVNSNDKEHTGQ